MVTEKAFFPNSMFNSTIEKHVGVIVNALWYIDGSKDKFETRCQKDPSYSIPTRCVFTSADLIIKYIEMLFSKYSFPKIIKYTSDKCFYYWQYVRMFLNSYCGYNDWKKNKKKAPVLSAATLKLHSSLLFDVLSLPCTTTWNNFKTDLIHLSQSLNSYSAYLDKSNEEQKQRQGIEHPVREVAKNAFLSHVPSVSIVDRKYSILDSAMLKLDYYEYLYLDEDIHVSIEDSLKTSWSRYSFLQNLKLSQPINKLSYNPGGSVGSTVFIWKVPQHRGINEVMNDALKVIDTLKPKLPEYHTRRMRRDFINKYSNLNAVSIPKHILRSIYSDLTMDATSDQNPAMDSRVRHAILSEDADLILDLRHLNKGRPGDTFDNFFDLLKTKVDEMSAADERRHGIEHLAKYISVRDLINDVKNDIEPETPIPSESTVLFAFTPKNSYLNTSKLYKSKVPLQFKVQTRQLRLSHQDDHYCAAQYKYMREYAIMYREHVTFLSIDDKSKIDIGEPHQYVSTGVRGKKSLVPTGSTLSALDHDVSSKGSITPSVSLNVQIPEEKGGSFYQGKVNVTYKDSIFQASSPWRHAAEMQRNLLFAEEVSPVLMLFSDGGPDHRITYHSVKLSLIILFKNLDLDILIAGRTAPGHSWINPVERIMSTLNIALQNAALARSECTSDMEQVLRSVNSMAEIRKKAERVPNLKGEWLESLGPIIEVLQNRTERLELKGQPFKCHKASSDENVFEFESQVHNIDAAIEIGKYQMKDLAKKADYQKFLATHCLQRNYIFQIRKCGNAECCRPRRCQQQEFPPLPDPVLSHDKDHFQPLTDVIGKTTTDSDRPSSSNQTVASVAEALQGVKNNQLTAQNVRKTVTCVECGKPRCLYSKKQLSVRESRSLTRLLEKHDYTCGALITPDGDALQGLVFVRLQLSCNSNIEFPYYAANNTRKDICCHCAAEGVQKDQELMKTFRVVLPVCVQCHAAGKETPKRNPIKNL
ncbi:uncharacterized protein [Mytilus edulis]|uniref:uncharacterized protein n=1 Tax=Mytilus edulis TaxID=6550 RepID=UPI0039EE8475